MKFNANRHSDGEQERRHEDVGVQRRASLSFYGEGGSEKPPLTEDKLVRELSFDVTRRFAVAEGSRLARQEARTEHQRLHGRGSRQHWTTHPERQWKTCDVVVGPG